MYSCADGATCSVFATLYPTWYWRLFGATFDWYLHGPAKADEHQSWWYTNPIHQRLWNRNTDIKLYAFAFDGFGSSVSRLYNARPICCVPLCNRKEFICIAAYLSAIPYWCFFSHLFAIVCPRRFCPSCNLPFGSFYKLTHTCGLQSSLWWCLRSKET